VKNKIDSILCKENIEWRKHVLIRLGQRNISQREVLDAVATGEIIESYPYDKFFPSFLIAGKVNKKALHVVVGLDEDNEKLYIITAYIPGNKKFEENFKKRRQK